LSWYGIGIEKLWAGIWDPWILACPGSFFPDKMTVVGALLFGTIILSTHILEGITGFGCTIVAMPFAVMLFDFETARASLTVTALIQCLYICLRNYRKISWRDLAIFLFFMGIGMPVGMMIYYYLSPELLKKILAVFSALVSVRGLFIFFHRKKRNVEEQCLLPGFVFKGLLVAGGIIHGAFTSGGPLVIIYALEKIKGKSFFRATMCAMWSILNSVLLAQLFLARKIPFVSLKLVLGSLPFLVAGILVGNIAHHRIKDTFFTPFSYSVLLVSSIFMFVFWVVIYKV
jgi:uncharacterized membrane protein YfcA